MNGPVLEVRDLNVWFDGPGGRDVHAVRGVSFDVRPGDRLALVGESGCGKTTTVLGVLGLLGATASVSGSVRVDGQEVLTGGDAAMAPYRWGDLSIVFQGALNALNPVRTVGSQIAEVLPRDGRVSRRAALRRAGELLERVGMAARNVAFYPHELSGGMRQRACIAMALAGEPRVLFADEPTTALDVVVQAQILELLDRLADELGLAIVLISHDLWLVGQLCDRAMVMYAGRAVEEGPTEGLYTAPRHPYTRLLYEATPVLGADRPLRSIGGSPPALDVPLAGCAFRSRCPDAEDRCSLTEPGLTPVAPARRAACHLTDRTP